MYKTIITFGSEHLKDFDINNGNDIMLVMEEPEKHARDIVMTSPIGIYFCNSYPYEKYAQEFKDRFKMKEITFDNLMKKHKKDIS